MDMKRKTLNGCLLQSAFCVLFVAVQNGASNHFATPDEKPTCLVSIKVAAFHTTVNICRHSKKSAGIISKQANF